MSSYFVVEPEVAGALGANTVMDRSVHPPAVKHVHYVFDGWLGDEVLESFPVWIVSDRLARRLLDACLTGMNIEDIEVSTSDQFRELYPNRSLPGFRRLAVLGAPGFDDFGVAMDGRLMISERALGLLRSVEVSNMLVEPAEE